MVFGRRWFGVVGVVSLRVVCQYGTDIVSVVPLRHVAQFDTDVVDGVVGFVVVVVVGTCCVGCGVCLFVGCVVGGL